MEQLKHHDELRSFDEVPLDLCELDDAELDLALKIIDQRVNDKFEPEKYQDEVRSRVLELIENKIDGQEISVPPEEKSEAKIVDLMEALRASFGAAKPATAGQRQPAKRAAAKNADAGRSRPNGSKAKQSKG